LSHSTYWLFSCWKDYDGSNCNRQLVTYRVRLAYYVTR
jgi:hypothetical protein